jgi:His/Glu/Gln/Arg/opine family amino acid ABC transporter permease subunit
MNFDLAIIAAHWPEVWQSFLLTLLLAGATLLLSTPLALLIAIARESGGKALAWPATAFVNTFRSLPILVVLYFAFYGLPEIGLPLAPVSAAMLGLVIAGTAYLSEDLRGGLRAVDPGQWQAARALGLPFWHTVRRIILPQALPAMVPPYVSRAIVITKSTSIAGIVTINELTGETYALISITYHSIEFLSVAALLYLAVNLTLAAVQETAERLLRVRHA